MRVFLVINETRFFLPVFASNLLGRLPDKLVGAALITHVPPRHDIAAYLKKHWYYLKLDELLKLVILNGSWILRDKICHKGLGFPFYSVRSVLDFFNINYFLVDEDINRPEYVEKIRQCHPDVIISSNPLIFKEDLLNIPSICCLNRHSSLLPAYGGHWPVFHAYIHGEPWTGTSVHTMEKKIDQGTVLSQKKVPIRKSDTIAGLYQQCYDASVEAMLEALEKVRRHDFTPHPNGSLKPSYYSFPKREDWQIFRNRGGRFI